MKRKFAIEKRFEYAGRECLCVFNAGGFRCGYVSVRTCKNYSEYNVDCHGGLTFSGELNSSANPKRQYYVGFDCAHYYDGVDYDKAFEYRLIAKKERDELKAWYEHSHFAMSYCARDLAFVEGQCKTIVEQLNTLGE